jgi:metallo-beta-lactamase class B
MKQTRIRTALAVALTLTMGASSMAAHAIDWYAPQDPFVVYGDTHYVGTHGISTVLITSRAGHILIDAGPTDAAPTIADHIRKLGFKVEDIRLILVSHAHMDHVGALAALQRMSGAEVLAAPDSVPVLRTGRADPADPQAPGLDAMAPVARVRAVRDGQKVRLGPLAVTAHLTPGHTRGGASWTWQATEGGRTVDVVYADSLNAVAADGKRFGANPLDPRATVNLQMSMAKVESFKCDILISAHPEFSKLWDRKAKQALLGDAAFIDPDACRAYAANARVRLASTLADEAAQDKARGVAPGPAKGLK